jgi:hypothetical protein
MDFKHKNHLVSGYVMLRKSVNEIRALICEGRTPTGTSAPLTPLPKEIQDAILAALNEILSKFEALAQRYAADELIKLTKRETLSVTKMWASVLLSQLRDDIADLHPGRFERKFGEFDSEEERIHIRETIESILYELEETQRLV